jgi:hypothetical protein
MVKSIGLTHVVLSDPNNGYEPYDNATPLPVVLTGGGGDATAANQVTMINHLDQIEQAVEGTLAVSDSTAQSSLSNIDSAVSGTLNVSDSVAQGSLASLDVKVLSCDTGAVVVSSSALPAGAATSALQGAGNADLAVIAGDTTSLDSKVTVCNTGAVAIASNADATKATSTLQVAGNASLSALEGSLYADGDTIGVSDVGVLMMGRNGTNSALPIHITSNGDVEVEIADFVKGQATMSTSFPVVVASDQSTLKVKTAEVVNEGSHANAANNISLIPGATSSVVDISNMNYLTMLYEDTATASPDLVQVEVSVDGTNYFNTTDLYPTTNLAGTKRIAVYSNYAVHGLKHLRLVNGSSIDTYTGVTATIVGSP